MGLINDIHDSLKRNVLITPVKARYWILIKVRRLVKWQVISNEDIRQKRRRHGIANNCKTVFHQIFKGILGRNGTRNLL